MVLDIPFMLKKDSKENKESKRSNMDYNVKTLSGIQIPDFFKDGTKDGINLSIKTPKTLDEKLKEKVEDYFYKVRKTATRLLYAIYYLSTKNDKFDFNQFVKFLKYNRDVIQYEEKYQQLTAIIYQITDNKEVYDILTSEYKKVVDSKDIIKVDIKDLTDLDADRIVSGDITEDNIDEILWYLYNNKTLKSDFGTMDIPTFLQK